MGKKKLTCWEYMQCEREPGGRKAEAAGICPAASDETFFLKSKFFRVDVKLEQGSTAI
jgi:hypothetical protein